ncbi:MAG TPA: response regulator [Nitrosopumilaceae archaeon]|nr:response regulator [Nitrosopumilaceae archaeon]
MPKLLLVDDEPDIASSIKKVLEREGFELYTYTDPHEALKEFMPNFYDLVILDIKMPKMNGFQLYRELIKLDGKPKFCFLTAFETYREDFKKAFPELDERRFLSKPMGARELLERLGKLEPNIINLR